MVIPAERLTIPRETETPPGERARFHFCPKCGRKGMYHIKLQYYRCRYCGTYIISPADNPDLQKPE